MTSRTAPAPSLDAMVDHTPPERDRAIDAMRALAIAVVVIWHTVMSLTYQKVSGNLSMPTRATRFRWGGPPPGCCR